jgi:hypothetical protein
MKIPTAGIQFKRMGTMNNVQAVSHGEQFCCLQCANCNREAYAECSLCRRTPYCSTFCQRKDWASHQVECVRNATEPGSIMLIVESSEQVLATQPE